jgi:hypothetical protein
MRQAASKLPEGRFLQSCCDDQAKRRNSGYPSTATQRDDLSCVQGVYLESRPIDSIVLKSLLEVTRAVPLPFGVIAFSIFSGPRALHLAHDHHT